MLAWLYQVLQVNISRVFKRASKQLPESYIKKACFAQIVRTEQKTG